MPQSQAFSYLSARGSSQRLFLARGLSTPAELLKTAEGERLVLNELQAQSEGGPI